MFFFQWQKLEQTYFFRPLFPATSSTINSYSGTWWIPLGPLFTLVVAVPFHWQHAENGELLQNLSICSAKIGTFFQMNIKLGGGNSNILDFHPEASGNDENVDTYFFRWVVKNHQPVKVLRKGQWNRSVTKFRNLVMECKWQLSRNYLPFCSHGSVKILSKKPTKTTDEVRSSCNCV